MKLENTLQNKARLFAQYHGQRRVRRDGKLNLNPSEMVQDNDYLELTPLSQITDEDAIECAKLVYGDYHVEQMFSVLSGEKALYEIHLSIEESKHYLKFDYLRSKGYALPWMGWSVEDMIEYGWIKLTL